MELHELNRLLSERAEAVCAELLSAGKRHGNAWLVGSVRNEPGDSMNVRLDGAEAGLWFDHATKEGGDLLSLVQHAQGHATVGPAAKWARTYLGLPDDRDGLPVRVFDPLTQRYRRSAEEPWRTGTAAWPYHDAEGNVVAYAVRFDRLDGSGKQVKDVMPLRFLPREGSTDRTDAANWRWKGWQKPAPVPLFNRHLLARHPDRPVLVVEGEKTALAAARLFPGHVCVTWQGGCSRVERADLDPLRGRDLVLWPDADAAGLRAMRFLHVALPGSRLVHLPDGLPDGWDLADPELPEFPVRAIFQAGPPAQKPAAAPGGGPEAGVPATEPANLIYDPARGVWWTPNSHGAWSSIDRDFARKLLILSGADAFKDETQIPAVDRQLMKLQIDTPIIHAGPVAGRPAGLMGEEFNRVLVTTPARLLPAVPGDCRRLLDFIHRLLGQDDDQIGRLLLWVKLRREAIARNRWRASHVLVLVGPADCGKTFLQSKVIDRLLTGRSAKCYRYLSGRTDFNGDHFVAEHLLIDDDNPGRDIDSRRAFGSNLKSMLFSEVQSCHPKGGQAYPLRPLWAVSACFNDEPENLQALPPMEPSMRDKLLILRCQQPDLPLTGGRTDLMDEMESMLAEIPALAAHIDALAIPDEWRSARCGFTAYQHPAILSELAAITPESALDELINDVLFTPDDEDLPTAPSAWKGSAAALETALIQSKRARDAQKLISSSSRLGVYLARLEKIAPDRYQFKRAKKSKTWSIKAAPDTAE